MINQFRYQDHVLNSFLPFQMLPNLDLSFNMHYKNIAKAYINQNENRNIKDSISYEHENKIISTLYQICD